MIRGIYTPNLVPFDDDGRINEGELRRMVNWLVEKGVSGLYPNGSTGEFTRFSFEERKEIVRIARANDVLIVEDDAYGFLVEPRATPYCQLARDHTVYLTSLSKSIAGLANTTKLPGK